MLCRLIVLLGLSCLAHGRSFNGNHNPLPKLDGRIVGGIETTIEEHPFQVSLELLERPWCGGSLIRPDVVLTAAHCTDGWRPASFRVRAGSARQDSGGQVAKILSICEHPNFYPYDYDVSVLRLDRSFVLGVSVQTIDLQPVGVEVPVGTLATVTGWGALREGGSGPTILQEVDLPKVADEVCKDRYPLRNITDRMTCYGYDEGLKDSCQGDSGGPLVVNGKQVGIVSWGTGCARPLIPGVYTRVENKAIQDHINSCINE